MVNRSEKEKRRGAIRNQKKKRKNKMDKNRKMAVSVTRNNHQKDVQRMVRDTTSVRSGSIFLLQLFQGCSINDPTFFVQYRRIKRGHHVRAAAECAFV